MERKTTKLFLESGNSINSDHEPYLKDADLIEFKQCSFKYNPGEFYHPVFGNYDVLGISVPIKEYSFLELKQLIDGEIVGLIYDKYVSGDDIFDVEEYDSRIDFTATITTLEARGKIKTRKSTCWMATDERAFSFGDFDSTGKEEWWEVDILGMSTGSVQTDRVIEMWEA